MIKVLIVDDSSLVRSIIKDFLESDSSFQVIGEAENGQEGVNLAQQLNPDLITMDIEMPVMNGLQAIAEIKKTMTTAIVVISTHDTAKMAYDATVKGAHEFYAKDIFTSQMSAQKRDQILDTLKHITSKKRKIPVHQDKVQTLQAASQQIKAVVIASSTGGPQALSQLCVGLPEEFPVPIILVQHNISGFDLGFVQWLNQQTQLNVCIAKEQVIPVKGNFYVAPTDKHLVVDKTGFLLDDSEPINSQKPAADLLFKSACELYGEALVSVVLTGMGCDGADGSRYVKEAGGITIAQDEASSVIYGMPQAAFETGCIDMVLSLELIAPQLVSLTKGCK
ncbi:MAG: chemotaxis-specific protein-glutamate methyltransferase CheB [Treponema sp.]|jgi:two-component system chemotaxis response regulator CheB|nr:chemotaxis-specific protein-glutamate methyltransferase CheB [Treponema sp.]